MTFRPEWALQSSIDFSWYPPPSSGHRSPLRGPRVKMCSHCLINVKTGRVRSMCGSRCRELMRMDVNRWEIDFGDSE